MTHVRNLSARLRRRDQRGATATEYGLLVAAIALTIILGVTAFGTALNDWWQWMGETAEAAFQI